MQGYWDHLHNMLLYCDARTAVPVPEQDILIHVFCHAGMLGSFAQHVAVSPSSQAPLKKGHEQEEADRITPDDAWIEPMTCTADVFISQLKTPSDSP